MKKQSGITLVALVITIIVLLILVMVSASVVINSGVVDKAKYAVNNYSDEEIIEQIKLARLEYEIKKYTNTEKTELEYMQD